MDAITSAAPPTLTDEQLLAHVEAFLTLSGMKPTRFGIEVMAEGGLVASLKTGRSLSLRNVNKVLSFITDWKANNPTPDDPSATKDDQNIRSGEWPIEGEAETSGAEVPHGPFSQTSSGTRGPPERGTRNRRSSAGADRRAAE